MYSPVPNFTRKTKTRSICMVVGIYFFDENWLDSEMFLFFYVVKIFWIRKQVEWYLVPDYCLITIMSIVWFLLFDLCYSSNKSSVFYIWLINCYVFKRCYFISYIKATGNNAYLILESRFSEPVQSISIVCPYFAGYWC